MTAGQSPFAAVPIESGIRATRPRFRPPRRSKWPVAGGGSHNVMAHDVLIPERTGMPDHVTNDVPLAKEVMLRRLSVTSEGFAYGSTALSAALRGHRRVTIAASLKEPQSGSAALTCWRCDHDEEGITLHAMPALPSVVSPEPGARTNAALLLGSSTLGDILVVCDPWGEHELLCRALRIAATRGVTTIAVTSDHPNLLAVLASHAVRVPVTPADRRDYVLAALRHVVQTAGTSLVPAARRITKPLRTIEFV